MPSFAPIQQLVEAKDRLGQVTFLDYKSLGFMAAHRELGQEVKHQAHRFLSNKLDKLSRKQLIEQIRLVRQCRNALKEKSLSPRIDPKIRASLVEYLHCLSAWCEGAELYKFQHHQLYRLIVDSEAVSANDLALFLQNDNTGCQTGVYRDKNGSVILWHTEEDAEEESGSRFDKLRIASFRIVQNNKVDEINAFIYPDLLPGPAYCWRNDNFVQAVDAFFLKPKVLNTSILANIATWMTWRVGNEIEPEMVIEALAPYIDGYALMVVQEKNNSVYAKKIEFAGDRMLLNALENVPGSFLFQVNILSDKDEAIVETIDLDVRKLYEERLLRTERVIKKLRPINLTPSYFLRLLSSRIGGDFAYANMDVKSYFVSKVSPKGMGFWIGVGPALKSDKPEVISITE